MNYIQSKYLKFAKINQFHLEVFADDEKSMIEQGIKISTWARKCLC